MAKAFYMPRADSDRAAMLTNLAAKAAARQAELGLSDDDITNLTRAAALFRWVLLVQKLSDASAQKWTAFKNHVATGPSGGPIVVPAETPLPPAPPLPDADYNIFKWVPQMVQRIKYSSGYTTGIGEELGIIGPEQVFDPQTGKPTIKLRIVNAGQIEIVWKKGKFQALEIEVDRGAGWEFLAVDSRPNHIDAHPAPAAPTIWKYRAVYRFNDTRAGEWSDEAQITVGGQ